MLCLYTSYKIEEIEKLTPKQVYYMSKAVDKKNKDQINVLSMLITGKPAINEENQNKPDFCDDLDTTFIDSIDNEKFDELMKHA